MTSLHPDAIQVVPCAGRRPGKDWAGGSAKRKLLLHTIEGADEDIGWPRDWTRWCSTPHLALNPWKYARGELDGLYQLIGFDKAGYALRDNAGEDDRYIWQVEIAGRAANVPTYDDDWYEGVAKLVDWFIKNMGVPDVFANFATPVRMTHDQHNEFAGILGHVHFGAGIDTHTDPGYLDVGRIRSFMYQEDDMTYESFRNDEFDLWTDTNIMDAYDAGMFQDPNRAGFHQYWVVDRDDRTVAEKARFLTDYYAHLWKRD